IRRPGIVGGTTNPSRNRGSINLLSTRAGDTDPWANRVAGQATLRPAQRPLETPQPLTPISHPPFCREARMLALSRPYRQAMATVALLAFTVAPTGYVILTACRINRPGHLRDVEVEIRRQLGLQVTLEGVSY